MSTELGNSAAEALAPKWGWIFKQISGGMVAERENSRRRPLPGSVWHQSVGRAILAGIEICQ